MAAVQWSKDELLAAREGGTVLFSFSLGGKHLADFPFKQLAYQTTGLTPELAREAADWLLAFMRRVGEQGAAAGGPGTHRVKIAAAE